MLSVLIFTWAEYQPLHLDQRFSTFLTPRLEALEASSSCATDATTITSLSLLLHYCTFATVMNCNINIRIFLWSVATPVKGLFDPQVENH